jgi:uncharacterized delta-60 repeat protein
VVSWGLVWLNTASGDGTPQLTTVPVSQTVTTGRGVTFTVAATSASGGLSYLWTKDGDPTVLATGTTLTLPSALPESAGTYRVAVSNSAGLVEATATLTVNPAPVSSPGLVRLDTVATSAAARAFVTAPDGTHLAVTTTQILRINPATGAPEGEYLPAAPLNGEIVGLVFDAQGRAYVYGSFRTMNGQPAPGVARFTTARTLDATFASALTDGDFIFSVAPRPSGGIYVGGSIGQGGLFTLNGRTTRHLVRLTDTGAIDTAFDPGGGTNNFVERLHLLADGRLLVGGNFSQAAGVARSGLVRFLPDGSIDPAFNNIAISTVRDFKVLPDGRLLVAHSSTSVDGLARPGVVRLSADGVVDPAFLFDRSVIETPFNLVLRADGRFNAVGWINVSGSLRYTVAQYLADGSLDPAFDSGRQFFNVLGNGTVNPGNVTALFLRPDGDLHVTGNFNRVDDGINRTNHARIHGSPLPPTILVGPQARTVDSGTDVTFTVTPGGTPDFTYEWRRNGTPINGAASATLALSAVTTAAAGDYTVEVTNALGSVTSAAATLTVNVTQQAQTITFAPLSDRQFTLEPVTLTATASSGLAVVYQVVSGPAAVDGNLLTFFGTGAVTIRATQPGNASFFAAEPIERTFTVTPDFSVWLIENFTEQELGNPALTGPNADFDGDGLSNLLEYALGLDPKVPSLGNLPAVGRTATHWTYTYTRPAARNDVTYVVESSTNLTSWSTANVTLTRLATGETETWQATVPTSAGANLFFRLRVTR